MSHNLWPWPSKTKAEFGVESKLNLKKEKVSNWSYSDQSCASDFESDTVIEPSFSAYASISGLILRLSLFFET